MQIINNCARLITVHHDGKDYRFIPAGDSVDVPEKVAKSSNFLRTLVDDGSLKIVSKDTQADLLGSIDPLDSLRDELSGHGVEVDKRWGEAKLREMISGLSDQEQ